MPDAFRVLNGSIVTIHLAPPTAMQPASAGKRTRVDIDVARRGDYVDRMRTATEAVCDEAADGDELLLAYDQLVVDMVAAYAEHRKQHSTATE
eukprot:COSAG06_NODE_7724_length_2398_cov_3.745542_2_plen_93_part_00